MTVYTLPSKTFLLGEYAVLAGAPALVLTSTPGFTITVHAGGDLQPHPKSPSGQLLDAHHAKHRYTLISPYPHHPGGLGQSGAEFIALWCHIQNKALPLNRLDQSALMADYHRFATQQGWAPSGADIMAQLLGGIAIVHPQSMQHCHSHTWPFKDLGLCIWRTPYKLATHDHLATLSTIPNTLVQQANDGLQAWLDRDTDAWIASIHHYAQTLQDAGFTTLRSQHYLEQLRMHSATLAAKGCGAMGADVLVALCHQSQYNELSSFGNTLGLIPLDYQISHPTLT